MRTVGVSPQRQVGAVLSSESRDSHRRRIPWLPACCCVLERMRGTGTVARLIRLFSACRALIANVMSQRRSDSKEKKIIIFDIGSLNLVGQASQVSSTVQALVAYRRILRSLTVPNCKGLLLGPRAVRIHGNRTCRSLLEFALKKPQMKS
jgi:hypothetical protein